MSTCKEQKTNTEAEEYNRKKPIETKQDVKNEAL